MVEISDPHVSTSFLSSLAAAAFSAAAFSAAAFSAAAFSAASFSAAAFSAAAFSAASLSFRFDVFNHSGNSGILIPPLMVYNFIFFICFFIFAVVYFACILRDCIVDFEFFNCGRLTRRIAERAIFRRLVVAIDDRCSCWNIYYTDNIYSSFSSFCVYFTCISFMGAEQSRSRSRSSHGTRKWSRVAPKTVGERSALLAKCGHRCFLGPRKTFPICPRLGSGSGSGSCKVDRRGVAAAYSRAREWAAITARKKQSLSKAVRAHRKYTAVARKAREILSKLHSR